MTRPWRPASTRPAEPDRARRAFLKGVFHRRAPKAEPEPLRPPWTDTGRLLDACTRCGDCLPACPEQILVAGDGGFPEVDFGAGSGECTFCGACALACPAEVFVSDRKPAWNVRAVISKERCLAVAGVHCEACRDACGEAAVRFRPRLGGPPRPELDPDRCTGCGACAGPCPADAITLQEAEAA
ncbi:ferredoxin-type protein NapF [Thalassobaculum sp.]|uniref:ferredoxin-type protein NapF n=1 Tax=Thalassobaculum sp. TaxID=2022740 RepID=UPI003B5CB260